MPIIHNPEFEEIELWQSIKTHQALQESLTEFFAETGFNTKRIEAILKKPKQHFFTTKLHHIEEVFSMVLITNYQPYEVLKIKKQ